MDQQWKREGRDWTYSEGCGCKLTFFAPEYRTSRMIPGEMCNRHVARDAMKIRDDFVERARQSLHEYLAGF